MTEWTAYDNLVKDHNALLGKYETVVKELRIARLKADYCERNHKFCPDCRDKIGSENGCPRCKIQKLGLLVTTMNEIQAEKDKKVDELNRLVVRFASQHQVPASKIFRLIPGEDENKKDKKS